jgi:hypothetical protein
MAAGHRRRIIALMAFVQLPLAIAGAYVHGLKYVFSSGGLVALGNWAFVSGVAGYMSWKVARGPRFNHEIIARRLRKAIATPDEPMEGQTPTRGRAAS